MLAFVAALAVEAATGRGVLEAAGVTTPLPVPALVLAGAAGVTTAAGVFRSLSGRK